MNISPATLFSAVGLAVNRGAENVATVAAVTPCAWCQREFGIAPQPHESHGICARHAAEELARYRATRKAEGTTP